MNDPLMDSELYLQNNVVDGADIDPSDARLTPLVDSKSGEE